MDQEKIPHYLVVTPPPNVIEVPLHQASEFLREKVALWVTEDTIISNQSAMHAHLSWLVPQTVLPSRSSKSLMKFWSSAFGLTNPENVALFNKYDVKNIGNALSWLILLQHLQEYGTHKYSAEKWGMASDTWEKRLETAVYEASYTLSEVCRIEMHRGAKVERFPSICWTML